MFICFDLRRQKSAIIGKVSILPMEFDKAMWDTLEVNSSDGGRNLDVRAPILYYVPNSGFMAMRKFTAEKYTERCVISTSTKLERAKK